MEIKNLPTKKLIRLMVSKQVLVLSSCLFVVLLTVSACSSTAPSAVTPVASEASSTADLEALYRARQDSARMRFTKADVDFMKGMIAHHAQALVMSAPAASNGASSSVQTLAARIINAQNDEIATMQQWLRDRDQTVPEVHIMNNELMVHGAGDHHMHMPGMLTQEQLSELNTAKGAEYDRLYLTYMIGHHQGAVSMVKELFATDGAGQDEAAFKLANDVQVDQITEINRMKLMLEALPQSDSDL